jgi:hypothetical protein
MVTCLLYYALSLVKWIYENIVAVWFNKHKYMLFSVGLCTSIGYVG